MTEVKTETWKFDCEDCGVNVIRMFFDDDESRIPVCMNCQWQRRQAIRQWLERMETAA